MNITEEKWPLQQQPPAQPQTPQPQAPGQVPHSPHHPHNLNGMSQQENYMQTYQYDGQPPQGAGMHPSTMAVHETNHTMYMHPQPKQEMDTAARQPQFQRFVSMPTAPPQTPGQQTGSPGTQSASVAPNERKVMDGRPAPFTTTSFHAAQYPGPVRKRRADALGYPVDAGPFFSQTKQHQNLYSMDRTQSYKLRINSKVDRGFFLADQDWTCYRRNYFQISSAFSITTATGHPVAEAETPCLVEIDGQFHSVSQFLLGITARVSNSDKKIDLVQHTPKRDKGPQSVPMPKPIRAGGNLNLSSVGSNSNIVTFERIQFKTATANNGKRRAAQQYYVILVDLYAQVDNHDQVKVATSTSAPLVVRGRSPGHYADNHDRYNPLAVNPMFNDRHLTFPHPSGHGGAPGVMPSDFGGAPFPPYGQYPFTASFNPVNQSPVRNDTLSLIMTSTQNPTTPPFPQHHPQPYMVPSISEVSSAESTNPDMYNTPNLDPNNIVNGQDQKITPISPQHHHHSQQVSMEMHGIEAPGAPKPYNMKIEIPQSSELPEHPLTSPAYHSQDYVDGFNMYHNGHPAANASAHHGGYHSDSEQHRTNGFQRDSNSQQPRSDGQAAPGPHSSSPQMNGESKTGVNGPAAGSGGSANPASASPQHSWGEHSSKSPPPASSSSPSTTTPTTELGKNLGQLNMSYRSEAADKI